LGTVLSLLLLVPAANAQPSLKQQLVGTWRLSSIINLRPDGTKYELFGPNANGMLMLDPNGFYSLQIMRSDWLPFARARMEGTAEENRSVVQSMISHFGTYTVDDDNRAITFHIISSSYPNWEKSEQSGPSCSSWTNCLGQIQCRRAGHNRRICGLIWYGIG
jgi:Lipocalin-like domain